MIAITPQIDFLIFFVELNVYKILSRGWSIFVKLVHRKCSFLWAVIAQHDRPLSKTNAREKEIRQGFQC